MKRGLLCMLVLLGMAFAETVTADAAPVRTRPAIGSSGTPVQLVRARRGRHHRHHRKVKGTRAL